MAESSDKATPPKDMVRLPTSQVQHNVRASHDSCFLKIYVLANNMVWTVVKVQSPRHTSTLAQIQAGVEINTSPLVRD